jgi:hypothetical protein
MGISMAVSVGTGEMFPLRLARVYRSYYIGQNLYMKLIITTIALLISLSSLCQMGSPVKALPSTTVGKISPLGTFIAELTYQKNPTDEKDTTYTLRMRNYKYSTITETIYIEFSGIGGTTDSLYNLIKTVFNSDNKNNRDYAVTVTLGKQLVAIANHRTMGTTMAMIQIADGYGLLSEKQLDKLFGKN